MAAIRPLKTLSNNKKYHIYMCRSHHECDTSWVAKLTTHLCKEWSIYSPENDFNPHLTISGNIEQAMTLSTKIIYVMSPHYVSSKMCLLETEIALKLYLQKNQLNIIIPVMIRTCDIPVCLLPILYIDARKSEEEWLPVLLSYLSQPVMMKPPVILSEGKQYHVFFVYRTVVPDKDWVKEIARSLETHDSGLKCAYHERDFIPGLTIFENITHFLKCSLKVVVVLTPDFVQSAWTKYETELAQLISMRPSYDVRIIPVVVQDCKIPESLINLTYLDATDAFTIWWPRLLKTINLPNEKLILQPPQNIETTQTLKLNSYGGKVDTDVFKSWLIDIQFVDCSCLLVTDARNKKLKKFSFKGKIIHELKFESRPMFITYFDDKSAYVTFPDETFLRVINTDKCLEVVGQIAVPIQCSGIAKINEMTFALTCRPKSKIYIMSRSCVKIRSIKPLIGVNEITHMYVSPIEDGDVNGSDEEANNKGHCEIAGQKDFQALKRQRLSLKQKTHPSRLVWPGFIAASEKQIFVTDYETCLLTMIGIREGESFHHKSIPLVDPRGVVIHNNMLYIAAGTIRIFTLDGEAVTEIHTHGGPITFPRSMTFDNTGHYMAVTHKGDGDDCISIYQLLYS